MQVGLIMSQPVVTVGEDTPLSEVAQIMLDHRIGGVPVLARDGSLAGMVTASDFAIKSRQLPFSIFERPQALRRWVSRDGLEALYREASLTPAGEVMSSPVITTTEDEPVTQVAARMMEHGIQRLPVLRNGALVGVVARHDLLRMVAAHPVASS